ncbi:bacillithiol biosynthesis cysteine-adding enzyme BshC [Puia dinghuensis]|uniref:Putative cysteine ligase BshC n=1 Tax=Puia dinghuensis TaxID=1792502 RepID=A0A8J2XQ52_9BACT|nr:bacillithiol biosynthesis cysteine-adding enzyme BshC [Puia dinghuensis]GGA83299.1 putative cysteine ligase BshC [Puia dinghuensis]
MDWRSTHLPYRQTGYFSRIISDYLDEADELSLFYAHPVSPEGFRSALEARMAAKPVDRATLVAALEEQYAGMLTNDLSGAPRVKENIARLAQPATFTVCTAHQPAIFTGHLYFIYKILHTIRLAEWLAGQYPEKSFVPVFYMGSEDADLEELGQIWLGGEKLVWDTKQTGAVGRMTTKGLDKLYYRIEGELAVQPHGKELMSLLKTAYLDSPDIQTATFRILHSLFAEYGLVVLIADKAAFKRQMIAVFEDDLFRQEPSRIVNYSIERLSEHFDIQANPRDINLFYLKGDLRGRIEQVGDSYKIHGSSLTFTAEALRDELHSYPERFSPNVILRGLFQETILPNLAFIGGGGETAYWLELKGLFDHYQTPFPVLMLRNSFLLVQRSWMEKMEKAGFGITDLFRDEQDLLNQLVRRDSHNSLSLEEEIAAANQYYETLKALARPVDPTLEQHVTALQVRAVTPIRSLEKKLLKAEKRKFADQQRQIHAVKDALFPHNGLQERVENILPWYAAYGPSLIRELYHHSPVFDQEFIVLTQR